MRRAAEPGPRRIPVRPSARSGCELASGQGRKASLGFGEREPRTRPSWKTKNGVFVLQEVNLLLPYATEVPTVHGVDSNRLPSAPGGGLVKDDLDEQKGPNRARTDAAYAVHHSISPLAGSRRCPVDTRGANGGAIVEIRGIQAPGEGLVPSVAGGDSCGSAGPDERQARCSKSTLLEYHLRERVTYNN